MNASIRLTEHLYMVGSGELGLSHYLDSHVYLLVNSEEYALVDAGSGVHTEQIIGNVRAVIGDLSKLKYIFVTHCHGDHAGGVCFVKQVSPAQVVGSLFESQMLEHGSEDELGLTQAKFSGTYPPDYVFTHASGDIVVSHMDVLEWQGLTITALITPGHTEGSTCFLISGAGRRLLFTGDTVFWGGLVALLNTPGSEIGDYRNGVQALSGLDVVGLFPGHGLWTLTNGQAHIDKLLHYFRGSGLPPMPARIEKIIF